MIQNNEEKDTKVFDLGHLYTEKQMESLRNRLAETIGQNERWQQMFEEMVEASSTLSLFIKEVYLTRRIEMDRLQRLYLLAEATERAVVAYRKRKDGLRTGEIQE